MELVLALGAVDEAVWLYLELGQGRAPWFRLVDPDQPVRLYEFFASSDGGSLQHPGEVPLADPTTLCELLGTLASELGPAAIVHDLRLGLAVAGGPRLEAVFREEQTVRLEAEEDTAFAPSLERLTSVPAARFRGLLEALRTRALTERHLRVDVRDAGMAVRSYRGKAELLRDTPEEEVWLPV